MFGFVLIDNLRLVSHFKEGRSSKRVIAARNEPITWTYKGDERVGLFVNGWVVFGQGAADELIGPF